MKRLKNTILTIVLTFGLLSFGNAVFAGDGSTIGNPCQDPSNVDPCCDENGNFDPACPIDTWVYVLLAAGVGLGIKRGRDLKINSVKA